MLRARRVPLRLGQVRRRIKRRSPVIYSTDKRALFLRRKVARGMTSRFFEEMRERFLTKVLGRRPPAVLKRAAAYRAECRWFEQSHHPI